MNTLPATIESEDALNDVMTQPTEVLMATIVRLRSPLVVLGGSGKMGPTLAVLAKRAAFHAGHDLHVVAVARFSDVNVRRWLESCGVETVEADLLDRTALTSIPDSENVVYMAGRKFGTQQDPAATWAMNTVAPMHAAERFAHSRIVALSTGCVYPLVRVADGGSVEHDTLSPTGEYAGACVARERIFEHYSLRNGTRLVQIRLNYALDLRYGVVVDLAQKIVARQPIDLTMGYVNCIWQRDANEIILRSFDHASVPPVPINVTSREILSVRAMADRLAGFMGMRVDYVGTESEFALLSDPSRAYQLFGAPTTPIDQVLRWTAHWMTLGGRTLGKPTHFDVADGRY